MDSEIDVLPLESGTASKAVILDADKDLSRRDFIKTATVLIGGFIGAALGLPALAYLISPSLRPNAEAGWISLGRLDGYPLNTPTLFQFTRARENGWERTGTSYGVFVLRQPTGSVRVFSNICTHLGCRVAWHPDRQHYISPCHDGHFDILGNVVSGPPPRPLDEFTVRVAEGTLYIQLPPFKRDS